MSLKDDVQAAVETDDLKTALLHTQRDLRRSRARNEDLVEAVYRATKDAVSIERAFPPIGAPPRDKRRSEGEVALWHLTDLQGGKRTTNYNREVMRRRVLQFTEKALHITGIQRAEHPVRSCSILYGGDMVEGLFQFPTQPFEVDATIFEQWASVSRLLADVARIALGAYDFVTVISEWGNHGRIGSKRDAVPTYDNLDRMCYEAARMQLVSEKRLVWEDSAEDIQRVEVGAYHALLLHGDEVGRNGYVSDSQFLNYLNSLKAGAYDWPFRDAYSGHYHTHNERAMADGDGAWYQTGSTESENRYARDRLGKRAKPSQRLHFIDPIRGRVTAQYKVHLD
jgi:hypothetical protein